MSMIINNNLMAMNASRNLATSFGNLSDSVRKLSSGLRVDRAADDAAGLAVRELMRADIGALKQGVRNANDAVSMIQTADGALQTIDEKLIRMKELAEQAATGTYNTEQRAIIDSEFQSMASEITRIANATDFNSVKLLDGSLSGTSTAMTVHFGTGNSSSEDYYNITISDCTASALGVGNTADSSSAGFAISTQAAAQDALDALNTAIISKDTVRANLGSMQNRLEATISNLNIQAENLQAAESRVSDVDVATEMTEFTRQQLLSNSASSMLAQANNLPNMAMQLLG